MWGERPSDRLGILDSAVAMDFDVAAALELYFFEQESEEQRMERLAGMQMSEFMTRGLGEKEVQIEHIEQW